MLYVILVSRATIVVLENREEISPCVSESHVVCKHFECKHNKILLGVIHRFEPATNNRQMFNANKFD